MTDQRKTPSFMQNAQRMYLRVRRLTVDCYLVTLIISAVWGQWALHASDRFVSVKPTTGNPTGEFDPHSNKTIVVVGSDCWLVMGYTGIAHLNGRPTDQLIAEAISGYADLSGAMHTFWFPGPYLRYREIRDRIESKLHDAYSQLSQIDKGAHNLKVLCSGLQRLPTGPKPVMFQIKITPTETTAVEKIPRFFRFGRSMVTASGQVYNDILNRMCDRLDRYTDNGGKSPIIFRDILIDGVIETSKIERTVSDRVMAVHLDPFNRTISSHFHSPDPSAQFSLLQGISELESKFRNLPSVPTPFVLMPGAIWGPSIGDPGGWDVMTDGGAPSITFEFTGFNVESRPGASFFAAQPRRPYP
jgi:hypothetical protein